MMGATELELPVLFYCGGMQPFRCLLVGEVGGDCLLVQTNGREGPLGLRNNPADIDWRLNALVWEVDERAQTVTAEREFVEWARARGWPVEVRGPQPVESEQTALWGWDELRFTAEYASDQPAEHCFLCGNEFRGAVRVRVHFPPSEEDRRKLFACRECIRRAATEGPGVVADALRDRATSLEEEAAQLRRYAEGNLTVPSADELSTAERAIRGLRADDRPVSAEEAARLARELGL